MPSIQPQAAQKVRDHREELEALAESDNPAAELAEALLNATENNS